jgi:hypothetical protein
MGFVTRSWNEWLCHEALLPLHLLCLATGKWSAMVGNAFGEASNADRVTLTRLSPLARDARETLHPAAGGSSSSLHLVVGVGVSCFARKVLLIQKMDGAGVGCRHTGRATTGMAGALRSGDANEEK